MSRYATLAEIADADERAAELLTQIGRDLDGDPDATLIRERLATLLVRQVQHQRPAFNPAPSGTRHRAPVL
jgi:hypothetical protein